MHIGKEKKGSDTLVTVEDIVTQHWKIFGRNYYTRSAFGMDLLRVKGSRAVLVVEHRVYAGVCRCRLHVKCMVC